MVVGVIFGFLICSFLYKKQSSGVVRKSQVNKTDAERDARNIIRDAEIQARSEILKARESFESSIKEQRKQINETMSTLNNREKVLTMREDNLDRKADLLDRKEQTIENKTKVLEEEQQDLSLREKKVAEENVKTETMYTKLSGMTRVEARKSLLDEAKIEIQNEMGTFIRRHKEETLHAAEHYSQEILLSSMQRYAGDLSSETTTKIIKVDSEDVKGRIIGREGRNIKAFESMTGVTVLVDDTPESIVVSGFDPVRREIAAVAMTQLLAGGRITPPIIEEVVASVEKQMGKTIIDIATKACVECNLNIASSEILSKLGRLHFRTSFSQNVLRHSVEVAAIAGMIASEIGLDIDTAKRAGLLHDIGKAIDHEVEGTHAIIGADLLRRNGEKADVYQGVAGHHSEGDVISIYAVLVSIADTISSARPGARAENIQISINRIEKLEKIALSFKGVVKAYAMQAGRDLRIIVDATEVSDNHAVVLAREISGKIEAELEYPGQIRVSVIRETRSIEYAR